ncbi:hypothetical protein Tco_0175133 [Tanacetum coccineum]
MEKSDKLNVRERNDGNQGAGASSASCDRSLKASNSSPLVSPTTTINMPRGLYNVDVVATFIVSLTNFGDLDVLIKDIKASKHDELLSGMTNDMCEAVMDALVAMCDSIQANNTNADAISCKILHVDDSTIVDALVAENLNVDESPIVLYVSIQNKPGFYIAAAGGSQPKPSAAGGSKLDPSILKANFRSLFLENLCEGVNVSIPRKVVETVFSGRTALALSVSNRYALLCWIPIPPQCARSHWGVGSFARCLIEINAGRMLLRRRFTICGPLIEDTGFTIETVTIKYDWKPPRCDLCKIFGYVYDYCHKKVLIPITAVTLVVPTPIVEMTNDGFQTVGKKKKKGKSNSINGGQIGGHLNQPPKATITSIKD